MPSPTQPGDFVAYTAADGSTAFGVVYREQEDGSPHVVVAFEPADWFRCDPDKRTNVPRTNITHVLEPDPWDCLVDVQFDRFKRRCGHPGTILADEPPRGIGPA